MNKQEVILSENLESSVKRAIGRCAHDKIFILTDKHTHLLCMPQLIGIPELHTAIEICIEADDISKTLDTLAHVWQVLSDKGATRHSLLINLGGGMVTDLGGFAAATFKRGLNYINIPTTLLAMVDASVGGKTGINFNGLKNEVGVFAPADSVLIDTNFLRTLDSYNFFSGYAEMLKHGLISTDEHWNELLAFNTEQIDYSYLKSLVGHSVHIKEDIVLQDPLEHGIRKALNLGHTVGHAFESLALAEKRPVLHGYAVAWGIVCELYLSTMNVGFPKEKLRKTVSFVKENYGTFYIDCDKYDTLYDFMQHDKKNVGDTINFTLLEDIGKIVINQTANKDNIFEMLDFYRECMGL
ncbi:3-dehydroquinate synthase [Bacteroides sp. 224]|uniref:3-dehydroquinate synthase n=1 Tax=Bacteroides sp. 224 TaxID=2302936 RepID=UPI0013D79092|nr:3-dehydroquinate synthase [Bacteroides sp. 224]NDV66431.1 3-dehydroquinate synthase [Bacteroides sp. 224]